MEYSQNVVCRYTVVGKCLVCFVLLALLLFILVVGLRKTCFFATIPRVLNCSCLPVQQRSLLAHGPVQVLTSGNMAFGVRIAHKRSI